MGVWFMLVEGLGGRIDWLYGYFDCFGGDYDDAVHKRVGCIESICYCYSNMILGSIMNLGNLYFEPLYSL